MLADAAADTAFLVDDYFPVDEFDREGAEGAVIDAEGTVFAVGAEAGFGVPLGGAHVDVVEGGNLQGTAGAGGHAIESGADEAGGGVGVDVGGPSAPLAGGVDLDALGGTDANAGGAATAGF